jgi:hypothetical protein
LLWHNNAFPRHDSAPEGLSDQMKCALAMAGFLAWLGAALLLADAAGEVRAQTTGAINAGEAAANDEPPPGGCMPIGVTASGEVVFPFLCKGFIERHKGAGQKPAGPDDASRNPAAADAQPENAPKNAPKNTPENAPEKAEEKTAGENNAGTDAAKQPDNVTTKAAEPASEVAAQGSSPKPVAAEEQPPKSDAKPESAEDKSAAVKPPEATASIAKSASDAAEPAASPDHGRRKPRESREGPPGCTHFRSYDAGSATYTDYSGRRRACRS